MDVQQKWMKECTTVDEVQQLIGKEQFLIFLGSTELNLWVMEKKPETCVVARELADEYEQARQGPRIDTGSVLDPGRQKPVQFPKAFKCGFCGLKGYTEEECRKKVGTQDFAGSKLCQKGLVVGRKVSRILLDTGCSRTMVNQKCVPSDKILDGKTISIRCALGDTRLYNLAEVTVQVQGVKMQVEAAVADNLPVDVLLGTDVPELTRLISDRKPKAGSSLPKQEDVMVVLTRARARQQLEEEIVRRAKQVQSQVETPRKTLCRGVEYKVEQLILPKQCKTVLELAHDIPMAGHQGRDKTWQRILRRFYWPSVFQDIENLCKSCRICQKASKQRVKAAPVISLPVISEPFSRVAMDIVGLLPRSKAGHRYILVLCDYATRYPEAIALRSIDAEHIAEELLKLFSRVGVPKEIITDQGSNFTSQLLAKLYRLLGVKGIRTSPYHPQTDGLIERFNQTLKGMLRKIVQDEGKDWD
ncbi:hypothetical protein EMCRGX_G025817 [Ephydatia muelleri]